MKSMIKIMTLAVLLTLLMPGIYGDAYGIYDADSNELSAYIFEMPVNPEIFAINDLYNYSNYYTPYLASFQNTVRTQYILEFTANDIDYEFETMVQTEGYEDVPAYIATEELTPDRINGYISTAQLYPGVEILGYPTEANVGIGPYCGVCVGNGVPDGPFYRRGDSRIALGTFMNVPYKSEIPQSLKTLWDFSVILSDRRESKDPSSFVRRKRILRLHSRWPLRSE